jgi:hypothetical protein
MDTITQKIDHLSTRLDGLCIKVKHHLEMGSKGAPNPVLSLDTGAARDIRDAALAQQASYLFQLTSFLLLLLFFFN